MVITPIQAGDYLTREEATQLRAQVAELLRRVEQLEGECRQNRQQLGFLRGRMNSVEMAS